MDIFRFITAGSVDDGKSTLIGRLLYDTKNIKEDILSSITQQGNRDEINLAHITDGLKTEREQGITIDIAYRYFTSGNKKYIIADAPGHFQYTKNMLTGASNVDAIIILIDINNGVTEQTRIHSLIASFLGIRQVVVAVNKMDCICYEKQRFISVVNEYTRISNKIRLQNITYIPISALHGDNILFRSTNMEWYNGTTLGQYLENSSTYQAASTATRIFIQYAVFDKENFYFAQVVSGTLLAGDNITVYPQNYTTQVDKITIGYSEVEKAVAGDNICFTISDNYRLQRGDLISDIHSAPIISNKFNATICWFDNQLPLVIGKEYILRIYTKEVICKIKSISYKIDINSLKRINSVNIIRDNEIGRVVIVTDTILAYEAYEHIADCGKGIIIDVVTNNTVGAFIFNSEDLV